MQADLANLLQQIIQITKEVGDGLIGYFGQTNEKLNLRLKHDTTPLTDADLYANDLIELRLGELTPEIPLISEESVHVEFSTRQKWERYWLVDPLDGTRGFLEHCPEFTINIALIDHHVPILGVIYAPVLKLFYYAGWKLGAFRKHGDGPEESITTTPLNWQSYRITLGRHARGTKYAQAPGVKMLRMNSSLKLGLLAEGKADIYPRFGEAGEWDTAAGQCVLEEAGGKVVDLNGHRLQYNTKASLVNPPFIAFGDASQAERILQVIQAIRRNP